MIRPCHLWTALALSIVAVTPALAGPPLLCHPYNIGAARSLPWNGMTGWSEERPDYPIKQLVADTEALLQPLTPVVVRMETLRRAAIYASRDRGVASALLDRLIAKADASATTKDALAPLDAAYLIEAMRQITMLSQTGEFRDRVDGVKKALNGREAAPFVDRAVQARPDDPSVAFAAALIAVSRDKAAADKYAERARAGASQDALVARNLDHLF
jgi:hypothetical protein